MHGTTYILSLQLTTDRMTVHAWDDLYSFPTADYRSDAGTEDDLYSFPTADYRSDAGTEDDLYSFPTADYRSDAGTGDRPWSCLGNYVCNWQNWWRQLGMNSSK